MENTDGQRSEMRKEMQGIRVYAKWINLPSEMKTASETEGMKVLQLEVVRVDFEDEPCLQIILCR